VFYVIAQCINLTAHKKLLSYNSNYISYQYVVSTHRCSFGYEIATDFCVFQRTVRNSERHRCLITQQFKNRRLNIR